MKAAIALLADYPTQNLARRMVFEMSQRQADMEFLGSLLPLHVSLKQPFTFEDLDRLEAWFDSIAGRTAPLDVALDSVYYSAWDEYSILGFNVIETPTLRALHSQINHELREIVKDPSAPHDGDEYRFHLTVELGKVGAFNPYKAYFDSLADKSLKLSFRATHLALFYYADRPITISSFIVQRVMPLGMA
ncbi:MAG: 2'-5' RNA ligase family protein [Chloroflexi bacterium]|nr:2'-5' RNA ligase family protein [Chloroflexota bacterium]